MPRPKHPFDAHHFRDGFLQTLGTYEGLAGKVVREKVEGRERQVALGVRILLGLSTDADLMKRLSRWSVSGDFTGDGGKPEVVKHADDE